MRILVLHQYFLGKDDPGGSRFNQLTKFWAENGNQVTVLAGTVHHGTGRVDPRYEGRWVTDEKFAESVRVLRCFVPRFYSRGYIGRLVGYIVFLASSLVTALTHAGPQDILVASSPPLTIGLGAYLISRFKRIPFVFEVRDLWPEFAIETGVLKNPWIIRLAYALESFIYKRADCINVLTPAFLEHLMTKKCVPQNKLIHIPNGADLDLMGPGPQDNWVRRQNHWQEKFVAMYVGAHSKANHLWQLLDTAEVLRDHPDILMVFVGDGNEREKLLSEAKRRGLSNLQMIGPQPKHAIGDFINAADVGIAVLKKTPGFKTVYPNKIFDYMSCQKPVVVGIDGEARRLVEEAQAGLYAEPENPQAFRQAILELYRNKKLRSDMGSLGYQYVKEKFARPVLAARYEQALKEVLSVYYEPKISGLEAPKRLLDLVIAVPALILLSPLMLGISTLIALRLGRPVLFKQRRAGYLGNPFFIFKLRTMLDLRDEKGNLLPESKRLTSLGSFLRNMSLDELPELFNVINGEMSLVGPRPLHSEYLPRYTPEQARRHETKPGITGWAQIHGRNALSWEEKFKLDIWYVDHRSLWLDIKILGRTLLKVARREGIHPEGCATMPEFKRPNDQKENPT